MLSAKNNQSLLALCIVGVVGSYENVTQFHCKAVEVMEWAFSAAPGLKIKKS